MTLAVRFVALLLVATALPVLAQDAPAGQVARSSAGQAGQRQTREEAAARINPLAAVNGRVPNRVQNRLRTRIDRFYDPRANTRSPYVVASEQVRAPGPGRR